MQFPNKDLTYTPERTIDGQILPEAASTSYLRHHPNAFKSLLKSPVVKKIKKPSGNHHPSLPKSFEKFMTDEEWFQSDYYKMRKEAGLKANRT